MQNCLNNVSSRILDMSNKLEIQIKTIVFTLVVSAFVLVMMSLGNGKLTIEVMLFSTVVCAVLTKGGELTLQAFRLTTIKAWLPTAFVVGFVAISLAMVALTLTVNLSALAAFWISALSVLGSSYFASRKARISPTIDWADPVIAVVVAISIAFLAKLPVSSAAALSNTGVLANWSDYFMHGITLASFGSPFVSGVDMELVGVSRAFYHYAPYMIPAAFQPLSGMSGLALSTSFLLPFGLLIAAFGSYAFAVELGGRLAGLFALTAIICLPAYSVFIQSGWFDFYWLLFIAPGSGYAIGVSAVVCASTVTYLKGNNSRVLWFTVLLLFSVILIRVHIFMLLAPAIVSVILFHRWQAHIRLLLGIALGAITIVMLAVHFSTYLHALWIEYARPHEYLDFALQWSPFYGQPIKFLEYPFGITLFAQILVVLAAVLGVYLFLYPLLFLLNVRRVTFHATDALPLLLIMSFIGLMLFAPSLTRNGDFTDYKHRHFLLLYVVIAIYTITYAFTLASSYITNESKFRQWLYGFVTCIFAATIVLNWNSNPARPNVKAMPWGGGFHNQSISPGLLKAAQYIRTHAKPGDVLAMGVSSTVTGPRVITMVDEVVSLTDIPAFIARTDYNMERSQCIREIVIKRLGLLEELSSIANWPDAQKFLQTNGIRWFLVPSGEKQKWDPNLEFTVFSINGISVYDAGHSVGEIFKKPQC